MESRNPQHGPPLERDVSRPPASQPSVEALFAELRASNSPAVRAALIERHLALARSLAARYRYTPQPFEDLVQVASLALVKAVDGFDPDRGAPFATYAVPTILGELKRHMRDASWAVHVPRALKERVLAVERAERALAPRLAASPTVAELAAASGMSSEEVLEALAARGAHDAVPLDPVPGAGERPAPPATVDDALASVPDRLAISEAIAGLEAREQAILRLRFIDGLTQSEIGSRVGLSQMQVSRVLRTTLDELRARIG